MADCTSLVAGGDKLKTALLQGGALELWISLPSVVDQEGIYKLQNKRSKIQTLRSSSDLAPLEKTERAKSRKNVLEKEGPKSHP